MRYTAEHKNQSRKKILTSASRRFRRQGVDAVKISDVMQAAGMTVGGFYKHFADKDQLLQEAVSVALEDTANAMTALSQGKKRREALALVIANYLSEAHMKHPELGCALAALGTEIGRMPQPVRSALNDALNRYASRLSFLMPGATAPQREAAFLVLFPSMAGCLMTARAFSQRARQRSILEEARRAFTSLYCFPEAARASLP